MLSRYGFVSQTQGKNNNHTFYNIEIETWFPFIDVESKEVVESIDFLYY